MRPLALLSFGPLAVAANLIAQQVPFNAIFLVSDPNQKYRLLANFLLYFTPFLAGAAFLGSVFLKAKEGFNRVYFADLAGLRPVRSRLSLAMYVFAPQDLILAPLIFWVAGGLAWFAAVEGRRMVVAAHCRRRRGDRRASLCLPPALGISKFAVSDYKGVAYARKFPDSHRVYERNSPFGYLEVYASSYLHFAPGLSDNAAFNLKKCRPMPIEGLYSTAKAPRASSATAGGRDGLFLLPADDLSLCRQAKPDTFVVQFGGGLSTASRSSRSKSVTVPKAIRPCSTPF